jgi:hypothetical protein
MMTKNHIHIKSIAKKGTYYPLITALLFSLCTKVVAQQSDKRGKYIYNKSTLFKNYYDKTTFKVDENGKVIADKKIRRFNKEKKTSLHLFTTKKQTFN